jgi:hypothetical protein
MEFEYKHVRFDYGLMAAVDRQTFDQRLMDILGEHGRNGWELKGSFHDFGAHAHLVFCRPVQEAE